MSWQNKYRPRKIAQLQLKKVRDQVQAWLDSGKLPSVMLFCGPKGTGKTSTARLIAALLNSEINDAAVENNFLSPGKKALSLQEPKQYSDDEEQIFSGESLAVAEIDAASNNSVDQVRELQKRLFMPNGLSKMTVYIFDEVHMFSNSAFNAMLKILEEPPSHVIFILATTEKHKIPATVMSRCSVVDFVKASDEELVQAFKRVLETEQVDFEPGTLELLARHADGSFRDGIKLLEAAALGGSVTLASARGVSEFDLTQKIQTLITLIKDKQLRPVSEFFLTLRQSGISEQVFYQQLLLQIHQQWLIALGVETGEVFLTEKQAFFLLKNLRGLPSNSPISFLDLELAILSLIENASKKKTA